MIRDLYHHKEICDKDDKYEHTVSAHYKDRIYYYRYYSDYLSQDSNCINMISDYNYIHNTKISDYKYILNIRDFNCNSFNPFYLDKISSCKTIEKLTDYYYKG